MPDKPIIMSGDSAPAILEGRKSQTRRLVNPQPPADWTATECRWYAPTKVDNHGEEYPGAEVFGFADDERGWVSPYAPGDLLWVRETWASANPATMGRIAYAADGSTGYWDATGAFNPHSTRVLEAPGYKECFPAWGADTISLRAYGGRWRSPLHLPRRASRLTLRVTSVRVQRVQDISGVDCLAEGCGPAGVNPKMGRRWESALCLGRDHYRELWDSLHAKPKPKRTRGVITHYVSHPWEDMGIQMIAEHRGKPWYVRGNPWVFVNEFERVTG